MTFLKTLLNSPPPSVLFFTLTKHVKNPTFHPWFLLFFHWNCNFRHYFKFFVKGMVAKGKFIIMAKVNSFLCSPPSKTPNRVRNGRNDIEMIETSAKRAKWVRTEEVSARRTLASTFFFFCNSGSGGRGGEAPQVNREGPWWAGASPGEILFMAEEEFSTKESICTGKS